MIVETKHGKVNIRIERNADGVGLNLTALDYQLEPVGRLVFHVEKAQNRIWLNSVKTNKKCQSKGIGSALLYAMEYIALANYGISNILGVFGPDVKHGKPLLMGRKKYKDYVQGFYERKNYVIDNYSTLSKNLNMTLAEYKQHVDCAEHELELAQVEHTNEIERI